MKYLMLKAIWTTANKPGLHALSHVGVQDVSYNISSCIGTLSNETCEARGFERGSWELVS